MKVIPIRNNVKTNSWISDLRKGNAVAQKEVYTHFSPKMLSVCRMYVSDLQHAEDCMIQAFVKVFKNISKYESKGSFEGWMRRIMVNECLTFLRFQRKLSFLEELNHQEPTTTFNNQDFDAQELLDQLPEGYKVVFNLFVIEEMSHKEIAVLLQISENTSKSQLHKAKKKLRTYLQETKKVKQ